MMMYIDRKAMEEGEVSMTNATLATMEDVANFRKECEDRSGMYSWYIPSYVVIDGNFVFYAEGPWEC